MLVKYDDLQAGDFFQVFENGSIYQKIMCDGKYRFILLPNGVAQANHKPTQQYVERCDRDGNPIKDIRKFEDIKHYEYFIGNDYNSNTYLKTNGGLICFGTENNKNIMIFSDISICRGKSYEVISKPDWVKLP